MTSVIQLHDDQNKDPAITTVPDRLKLTADNKKCISPEPYQTMNESPDIVKRVNQSHRLPFYGHTLATQFDCINTGFIKKISSASIFRFTRNYKAKINAESIIPIQNNNNTTESIQFSYGHRVRSSDQVVTAGH